MKDQVLSIEQMQKLKKLGVDISNASMCWIKEEEEYSLTVNWGLLKHMIDCFETFTLQDIIELMPDSIEFDNEIYYLEIHKNGIEYTEYEKYESLYICNEGFILLNAYNMLVWLAEHNYI